MPEKRLVPLVQLSLDNNLERFGLGSVPEGFVGIKDFIELEVMRNQELWVDFF